MSTVTVVATVEPTTTPPRVRLDVTDRQANPEIASTTVTRRNPNGTTTVVRTPDGNPLTLTSRGTRTVTDGATTASSTTVTSATAAFTADDVGATISGGSIPAGTSISSVTNGTAVVISAAATATATAVSVTISGPRIGTVYDYEAPYGAPVSFSTRESPTVVSAEVTVPADGVWLTHVGVPALSMPISVASFGSRTRAVQRGVYRPMGRKFPVVHTDGQRKAPEGTIELNTFTLPEMAAFESLTEDGAVLLLNVPADLGWGVPTAFVSLGDIEENRLIEYAGEPRRVMVLPYLVVDAPTGGTTAARSLDSLLVYPTLNEVAAAYPTLNDLLAGP